MNKKKTGPINEWEREKVEVRTRQENRRGPRGRKRAGDMGKSEMRKILIIFSLKKSVFWLLLFGRMNKKVELRGAVHAVYSIELQSVNKLIPYTHARIAYVLLYLFKGRRVLSHFRNK